MAQPKETAMTQQTRLVKPFRSGLVRKNPTGFGDYVPHSAYVERMLHVGPYDFEIVEIIRGEYQDKSKQTSVGVVGCLARLTATIDGIERTVVEVGDCENPSNWPHDGARLKDAASDSFKRCCMRGFGLGLHLYSGADFALYEALRERDERAADSTSSE